MVITALKPQQRQETRVNVFVDGGFVLSLDITQVVDFGLKVGVELSEEKMTELQAASDFGKIYARALEWVLVRPRAEREVRDYLWRKAAKPVYKKDRDGKVVRDDNGKPVQRKTPEIDVEKVIERLKERKYIDDVKFAEWWVDNRSVKKGASKRRLTQELMKKGVAKDVMERVMGESKRDDQTEIEKIILKKRARYDDDKLCTYLVRQGFDWELVKEMVRSSGSDKSEDTDWGD